MAALKVRNSWPPVLQFTPMRKTLALLIIIPAFVLPYTLEIEGGWWKFIPSSVAIIAAWRLARPKGFTEELGLRIYMRDVLLAIAAFLVVAFASEALISGILNPLGYISGPASHNLGWKYLSVFQALNEEMLLRGLLLIFLMRVVKTHALASIIAAFVFSALHFVFYRYGDQATALQVATLTTLFLFALACNALYFAFGNIAVAYAIHVGWNVTRFGNDWMISNRGARLQEAAGFNLIEGNLLILAFALGLAVVALGLNIIAKKSRSGGGHLAWTTAKGRETSNS